MVTSGHVTKMPVTPFDLPYQKTLRYTQTSWLYVLWNRSYCRWKFYIAGIVIVYLYAPVTYDLDPITFIYLFDLYYLEIYLVLDVQILTSYVKALKSYCHTQTVKQKNRETELKLYTTPLCKWSISYLFCFSFSFCFSHNCTN